MIGRRGLMALGSGALLAGAARAQGAPLSIGVLTDAAGPYADSGGPGSLEAARMAVADFGGTVLGRPLQVILGDTRNKPDVAGAIARAWYDSGVAAITDLPVTPVALAVLNIAQEKQRTVMITAAAISEFTSKFCTPVSTHWADDTHAITTGTARKVVERGGKSWFFITVDFTFGHQLQEAATRVIEQSGGTVLGSTLFPIGNTDFSTQLVQAASSGAQVVGLAAVGGDLVNAIKQAGEFGLNRGGRQRLAAFLVYLTDVHALGLEATQGLVLSSGFYWEQSATARAFAERFFAVRKAMPTRNQAAIYVAVRHFLRAMAQAHSTDALAVARAMRALPVDYMGHQAKVRADGRVLYDMTLYEVKAPGESGSGWDLYKPLATLPAAEAFLPMNPACAT
ncbi:MAG TPA: ABC transporter substrate-binding protein [Acetobacteraceae bacterium]|jgi:branched-chain amino acid transport system substrate-binding protein|nr:ABC transporter substrate-binding protein [Acetobacteraceae bacterium]